MQYGKEVKSLSSVPCFCISSLGEDEPTKQQVNFFAILYARKISLQAITEETLNLDLRG